MKRLIGALGTLGLLTWATLATADVAVIVNASATANLSRSDVANIFLGKDKSFKGLDLDDWPATKEAFYGEVTHKNESQLRSYWSGLVFTGKGEPLPSLTDDAAVVAQVSSQADAIGYVDDAAVTGKVRVLFTLP